MVTGFMKEKIGKQYEQEVKNIPVEFKKSWITVETLYAWVDKICKYSSVIFNNEPSRLIVPLFKQLCYDKPSVMKGLSIYLIQLLTPSDDLNKEEVFDVPTPTDKPAVEMFAKIASSLEDKKEEIKGFNEEAFESNIIFINF